MAALSASALTSPVRKAWLWGPVLAYMAVIFYLSAQSNPPVPGGIPDWMLHGGEYFGFAVVVFRAVSGGLPAVVTRARVATTMAMVMTYAISDEVHQLFVPYRTADVRDAGFNVAPGGRGQEARAGASHPRSRSADGALRKAVRRW